MTALADFREAYTAMLLAAERLRAEVDPSFDGAPADIRAIQAAVAECFRIPLHRLLSRSRDDATASARMVAMVLCRELTRHSLLVIGEAFARDHGTVMHAIASVSDRCENDRRFAGVTERAREAAKAAIIV